jgi:hypothetical protein
LQLVKQDFPEVFFGKQWPSGCTLTYNVGLASAPPVGSNGNGLDPFKCFAKVQVFLPNWPRRIAREEIEVCENVHRRVQC